MRTRHDWVVIAIFLFTGSPCVTWADEGPPAPEAPPEASAIPEDGLERYSGEVEHYGDPGSSGQRNEDSLATSTPGFTPPPSGQAMRVRSAAGRGPGDPRPVVSALAPEPCGQTRTAQPVLFWHVDRIPGEELRTIFHLTTQRRDAPVAELRLPRVTRPGLQRIVLADYGVRLEPGVVYKWSAVLVPGGEEWGRSIFASAGIRLVEEDIGESPELPTWYDAFAEERGSAPRRILLHAVGLNDLTPMP